MTADDDVRPKFHQAAKAYFDCLHGRIDAEAAAELIGPRPIHYLVQSREAVDSLASDPAEKALGEAIHRRWGGTPDSE